MNIHEFVKQSAQQGVIRYFNGSFEQRVFNTVNSFQQCDIEPLLIWWALSSDFKCLLYTCLHDSRKIQPTYEPDIVLSSNTIDGVLDVQKTINHQILTLNPTEFYVEELNHSWESQPNVIIHKILSIGYQVLSEYLHHKKNKSSSLIEERSHLIIQVLHTFPFNEFKTRAYPLKISVAEKRLLSKNKNIVYRQAYKNLLMLEGILNLDFHQIQQLFLKDLLPNLEPWRLLEISVIFQLTSAISQYTGETAQFRLSLLGESSEPIVKIGQVEIFWQQIIRRRPYNKRGQEAQTIDNLCHYLGVAGRDFRTDILIKVNNKIQSIIECKWFENPNFENIILRQACEQVVPYAYDICHNQGGDVNFLLSKSLIVLSFRDKTPLCLDSPNINCIGLSDFCEENYLKFIQHLGLGFQA